VFTHELYLLFFETVIKLKGGDFTDKLLRNDEHQIINRILSTKTLLVR